DLPFVWSPKSSAVYESFPRELAEELESVEFAVWYFLDATRSAIPQHILDRFPADPDDPDPEDSVASLVYQAEMDRAFNIMRSVKAAWSLAPEPVICEFGDLSKLPTGSVLPLGEGDNFDLWWPAVLLYLALQEVDVVLSASADSHMPWDSIFDDLPEGGDHEAHIDAFDPTTLTVSLSHPSLIAATRCALRAFRRVAEASIEKPGTEAKFQWKQPMLEGYVRDLLRAVEYPTEREAAEWISAKSGKPGPARATLRQTWYWQNRPQKTPKPRTTNEAQSGVSLAQNADAEMSHEEVTDAVLEIEEKLCRQLKDDERAAVAWTLQHAGAGEEEHEEAIRQLIQGFRSGDM
ncbi:MAG: hypothetical protein CMJ48_08140, partial [Planctomycetaceae bacterium]|nr:hypothetical protein [Planctomycetaceae bacterium]